MVTEELTIPEEVLNLLEAEPLSGGGAEGVEAGLIAPGPDIPALREQLDVLVSTGKAKEAIGVQLIHEQVKRLSDKDIDKYKYTKRYETYVGSKTDNRQLDRQLHFPCFQSGRNGS